MARRKRTWGHYKKFIEGIFFDGVYEILLLEMIDEMEEKFPDGVPIPDISREDSKVYLIAEKFKDFTAS